MSIPRRIQAGMYDMMRVVEALAMRREASPRLLVGRATVAPTDPWKAFVGWGRVGGVGPGIGSPFIETSTDHCVV